MPSEKSQQLYDYMVWKGYPPEFAHLVTETLNTDFTASKMIGYLSHYDVLPLEMVADEMFAILALRDRVRRQHILENSQAGVNEMWLRGFDNDEENYENFEE